jgi:hypothetical protein
MAFLNSITSLGFPVPEDEPEVRKIVVLRNGVEFSKVGNRYRVSQ